MHGTNVSIIIINFNTCELTCNCIKSIIENTKNIVYEILVVDNASSDNSVQQIKLLFPEITLIECDTNLGFGRANNLAARQAKGEFLFLLNSDTILFENSLEKMVAFFKASEVPLKIGSLGCILVDNEKKFNGVGGTFPDCKNEGNTLLSAIPVLGNLFFKSKTDPLPFDKEYFEIDYVIGADLMIRSSVFNILSGFDPAFFMYYEESDLQKRMHNELGLKSYIYTQTRIIHLEDGTGKSQKKYNNKKRILVHRSRNIYLKKHDPENFKRYKRIEKFYCFLSGFNPKYSKTEHQEFINSINDV